MSDGTFAGARTGDRSEVLTATRWPGSPQALAFYPTAWGDLERSPETGVNSVAFRGDATGFTNPGGAPGATFATPALTEDVVIAGVPRLRLSAAVTAPRVHLITTLYDQSADGERRRIGQFALNPELRAGIANRQLVTPGTRYDMTPPGFAMAHHLRAGHKLVLKVTTADPDKVPTFANDPQVKVFTGPGATSVSLPVVPGATLYPDQVPLEAEQPSATGPAQPPLTGFATPAAPGAGARVAGVDSAFFEFDSQEGFDNARALVKATYATGDVDLYLQRRQADGSWSDDLASGTTADVGSETMQAGRLAAGRYRIEVVKWAAPPGTTVDLALTFFNSAGEAGT